MKILLRLATVFVIFAGCSQENKVEPPVVNVEINPVEQPSQISYKTAMNFSSAGLLRAILHAGRVQTFDAKHYTLLDSAVRVDFYDKLGQHSTRLTSVSARINNLTNNMTAYGNVHIVSDSGSIVDTDSMVWDNRAQTLHSEAHVRIAEKSGRITLGDGFQSDQSLTHYEILHPNIQAPSGTLSTGNDQPANRPQPQAVPGAGAFQHQTNFGAPLSTDTAKKK